MLLIRICMAYPCVFCCSDWCQFPGRHRPVATQLGIGVRHRGNGKLTWATHCILTETMFRIDACASQVEYLCAHRLRSSSLHYAASTPSNYSRMTTPCVMCNVVMCIVYEYIRFRRRIFTHYLYSRIPCSSILLKFSENSPRNKLTSTYLSSLSLFRYWRQHLQVQ